MSDQFSFPGPVQMAGSQAKSVHLSALRLFLLPLGWPSPRAVRSVPEVARELRARATPSCPMVGLDPGAGIRQMLVREMGVQYQHMFLSPQTADSPFLGVSRKV